MVLLRLVALLVTVSAATGGSLCPPRESIYPCSCTNINLGRNIMYTIVYCHRLKQSSVLGVAFSALRSTHIDQFHLYDSFWDTNSWDKEKRIFPINWVNLRIKEIEIVNTQLEPCFACEIDSGCKNSATTRFTLIQSYWAENICSLCKKAPRQSVWNCFSRLQTFQWSGTKLSSLNSEIWPLEMKTLTTVNFTRNQIKSVDPKTFENLTQLKELDLSHNRLHQVTFINPSMKLQMIDLSWNHIQTLGATFLSNLPNLKILRLNSNAISDLQKNEWDARSDTLKIIDLSDNPIHCDCNIRWVNTTLHASVTLLGTCASPEEYANKPIRRAASHLTERCIEETPEPYYETTEPYYEWTGPYYETTEPYYEWTGLTKKPYYEWTGPKTEPYYETVEPYYEITDDY